MVGASGDISAVHERTESGDSFKLFPTAKRSKPQAGAKVGRQTHSRDHYSAYMGASEEDRGMSPRTLSNASGFDSDVRGVSSTDSDEWK